MSVSVSVSVFVTLHLTLPACLLQHLSRTSTGHPTDLVAHAIDGIVPVGPHDTKQPLLRGRPIECLRSQQALSSSVTRGFRVIEATIHSAIKDSDRTRLCEKGIGLERARSDAAPETQRMQCGRSHRGIGHKRRTVE